jgi:hypothetical protein
LVGITDSVVKQTNNVKEQGCCGWSVGKEGVVAYLDTSFIGGGKDNRNSSARTVSGRHEIQTRQ